MRRPFGTVAFGIVSFGLGCVVLSSLVVGCKDTASTITEKSISVAKETTKGIEDGVEKGRKSGESLDGATIVSNAADLAAKGGVSVYAISSEANGSDATITLAFENTSDKPMRITKLEVMALDNEGFVLKPHHAPSELTVAAKAKDKLTFSVASKSDKLAKVRCWDKELEIGPEARKRTP
ncbi:hypothetical protein AKJ09_02646 [Labilithrix luteola]|uniref:Uncharacterized protein n=1 Tax=Labilithrix luteola TaxID=1391654 RepID=A0A0K1PR32_9BACT|nr:hypothetical protein [Labilithrix luteola]AKU95982.1 hypothetical protein AKJ09_02646 [Labilithrix luteola]